MMSSTSALLRLAVQRLMSCFIAILMVCFLHYDLSRFLLGHYIDDWDDVFDLADTSVHGALHHAKHLGWPAPEIGYDITDEYGAVIATLEVAWLQDKVAIEFLEKQEISGWAIYSPLDFLEQHSA